MNNDSPILSVKNLAVGFRCRQSNTRVVRGVSFDIRPHETVALVGESGCGKSVTVLAIGRLHSEPPVTYPEGEIYLNGRDVLKLSPTQLRAIRGREVAYIFQDPATALNPVYRIGFQLMETISADSPSDKRQEAIRLLSRVGLPDPESCLRAYPHQLSGGMQQRVVIAMALACRPKLLIADEPTTALDVTIQAQILELLKKIQMELGTAILLITHNLGLVADIADRINVMYAGIIVESGAVEDVLLHPRHPYTAGLLNAVPSLEFADSGKRMTGIEGTVPMPEEVPVGCPFAPRCKRATASCNKDLPHLISEKENESHLVRCPKMSSPD